MGNTGEGKSHTLNQTFFAGETMFSTSESQSSCTTGVWAAYDPEMEALLLDTEGLQGSTDTTENTRTRTLMKVLAVSDIVIYRTRAERLNNDMFYFLGDASKTFTQHFRTQLEEQQRSPALVIFHETLHTDVLATLNDRTPETQLRERFHDLKQDVSAFDKILYVGTRSAVAKKTNFGPLRALVGRQVKSGGASQRKLKAVYRSLSHLNERFREPLSEASHASFPDRHLTCPSQCQVCTARCTHKTSHKGDHQASADSSCQFVPKYANQIYSCRRCADNGRRCVVVPKASSSKETSLLGLAKFAWSGFVLECENCGEYFPQFPPHHISGSA